MEVPAGSLNAFWYIMRQGDKQALATHGSVLGSGDKGPNHPLFLYAGELYYRLTKISPLILSVR